MFVGVVFLLYIRVDWLCRSMVILCLFKNHSANFRLWVGEQLTDQLFLPERRSFGYMRYPLVGIILKGKGAWLPFGFLRLALLFVHLTFFLVCTPFCEEMLLC